MAPECAAAAPYRRWQARFACVDGPEFDAHQVDFQILTQRNHVPRHRTSGAGTFQQEQTAAAAAAACATGEECRFVQKCRSWRAYGKPAVGEEASGVGTGARLRLGLGLGLGLTRTRREVGKPTPEDRPTETPQH